MVDCRQGCAPAYNIWQPDVVYIGVFGPPEYAKAHKEGACVKDGEQID